MEHREGIRGVHGAVMNRNSIYIVGRKESRVDLMCLVMTAFSRFPPTTLRL